MPWSHDAALFFGAVFFTNAIPHLVSGLLGHPFQSPFARPPGVGLSSSMVNVAWGTLNLSVAWALLFRVGVVDLREAVDAGIVLGGVLLRGLLAARRHGQFYGGNL